MAFAISKRHCGSRVRWRSCRGSLLSKVARDQKSKTSSIAACPCGTGRPFEVCCGPLHAGAIASTAQALMRSRYCAFVLKNEPYLLATWHATKRPASIPFDPNTKWLGLEIVDAVENAGEAEVEFIARFRIGGGSAVRLHDRSRFVHETGRWFYVDGQLRDSK